MNGFIEIVSGTLGGGKTAFAAERAFDHLCKGGYVYSNVEFYPTAIAARMAELGLEFDPSRLVMLTGSARKFHEQISRGTADSLVMLVIDEAGLELNARDYKQTDDTQMAFNTMARKLDIHLVYISQDMNDVDKQIRRKADTVWICRNMKKLKIWGVLPFPLPFYFRVRMDNTRGKLVKHDSEVVLPPLPSWGLYNSDAMVGDKAASFANLKQVVATPLRRIPKVKIVNKTKTDWLPVVAALCAAFYVSF